MNILVITQYYWPEETGPGVSLDELAIKLVEKKYKVTILTGMPNYPNGKIQNKYKGCLFKKETRRGVKIIRGWFYPNKRTNMIERALSSISFVISSLIVSLTIKKVHIIYSLSSPVLMCFTPLILSKIWNTKWVSHVTDLFSNAIILTNYKYKKIIGMIKLLENKLYRTPNHMIINSSEVERYMQEIKIKKNNISFINDWADEKFIYPQKNRKHLKNWEFSGKTVILFSGNMGYSSALDPVLYAANKMRNIKNIQFILMGDGVMRNHLLKLKNKLDLCNLKFYPFQNRKNFRIILNNADATIVSLSKDGATIASQGKLYTQMAAGKPIIGITPNNHDIAKIIQKSGCGWFVEPGDIDSLTNIFKEIANEPKNLEVYGRRARTYFMNNFSLAITTKKVDRIFKDLYPIEEYKHFTSR